MSAYGSQFTRSFAKWGISGAGIEIVWTAWSKALELAHEFECPYADLAIPDFTA